MCEAYRHVTVRYCKRKNCRTVIKCIREREKESLLAYCIVHSSLLLVVSRALRLTESANLSHPWRRERLLNEEHPHTLTHIQSDLLLLVCIQKKQMKPAYFRKLKFLLNDYPQDVPKLYDSLLEHKRRHFELCAGSSNNNVLSFQASISSLCKSYIRGVHTSERVFPFQRDTFHFFL